MAASAVLLAACGGSSSTDDSDSAEQADTEQGTSAAETRPTPTTEAAADTDSDGAAEANIPTTEPAIVDLDVTQIPGDPREVTVSALREGIDAPLLPEPLVAPDEIRSGGPPPDGIPSIDEPKFDRASEVDWLEPQEAVVTLSLNGDARAYPVQVMIWHEIVNDTIGGEPVTVTYCPLCNTAIGYHRRLGERTFDFGTSGSLYKSALVMYDRQTESLWAHFTGQAIAGALTGSQLELIPMATVAFGTFAAEYPNGLVLARPTGLGRSYGNNPYVNYDDPNGGPYFGAGERDERLPQQTRVLTIRHGGAVVAVVHETLAAQGAMTVEVGGAQVAAFHLPGTASPLQSSQVAFGRDVGATGVFDPNVEGQVLSFSRIEGASSSGDQGAFTDDQTGSTWTVLGRAVDGPLSGTQLVPIEHIDTFWFAAVGYNPGIELIGAP